MGEYIVIGAGLAGAATAWRLAQRGQDVTLLERSAPANPYGSSHGSARIFRYAYPSELYTGLVIRSKPLWDELERENGARLIEPTGALDHGSVNDPVGLARVLDALGIEHELLPEAEAGSRWPQYGFDGAVLYHPGAGVLDARNTVEALVRLAAATGRVRLLTNWTVSSIERRTGRGFRVESTVGDVVEGEKVVVAAGPWLPTLLDSLALPAGFIHSLPSFEVREEQAFHFPYRDADASGAPYPAWPTFMHENKTVDIYGLPGGRDAGYHGLKIAHFNGGPVIPSILDRTGQIRPEARQRARDYVKEWVPGVEPDSYAEATCMFTSTPSSDFLIDEAEGIVVLSACSGRGAKFAPLLGELAADLATGAGTVPDEFRAAYHSRRSAA